MKSKKTEEAKKELKERIKVMQNTSRFSINQDELTKILKDRGLEGDELEKYKNNVTEFFNSLEPKTRDLPYPVLILLLDLLAFCEEVARQGAKIEAALDNGIITQQQYDTIREASSIGIKMIEKRYGLTH